MINELFNDVKFRFNRVDVLLAIQNLDNFDFIYADPPYGKIDLQPLSELF